MGIKKWFRNITGRIGLAIARQISPVLKEAIDNPENLKFEGCIKRDELIIKVKIK